MRRILLCLTAATLASAAPAGAQFFRLGPQSTATVFVPHAPESALNVKRVAFGQPEGSCRAQAQDLIDRIILPDFQKNQVDVVERQALGQMMSEQNFDQGGDVDPRSAAALGKILGPSALILVTVDDCSQEKSPTHSDQRNVLNNQVVRTFISTTRYTLEGSLRVVDLTTGQIKGSHNFESKQQKQSTATDGQPEFPEADDVKDMALQDAGRQIHNMFFDWAETPQVIFYDDKDCGLKQVYEMYKGGDINGAQQMADKGVEQCKSEAKKEKALDRASYDSGLLLCLQKHYAKSSELFASAMQGKGADAAPGTSAICQRAQSGDQQVQAHDQLMAQLPDPQPISSQAASAPAPRAESQSFQPSAASKVAAPAASATMPVEQRLKQLDDLLKKGLITKKEYDQKRATILATI